MAKLSGFRKRIKLTADSTKIDSDLSHFPLTIFLKSGNGDTQKVFDELGDNKYKIAVTKADGTTQLYVEIEQWDSTNKVGVLHAGLDGDVLSSSSNTDYYLYYDNTAPDNTDYVGDVGSTPGQNVWDSSFKMVQHMVDTTTSTITDSTANNNDGTKRGANEPIEIEGKIAKGQSFDGSNDYVSCGSGASLDFNSPFAIEAWVKIQNTSGVKYIITKGTPDLSNGHYGLYISDDKAVFVIYNGGQHAVCSSAGMTTNTWYHIVGVWDGSNLKIYKNTEESVGDTLTSKPIKDGNLDIGRLNSSYYPFKGTIDEVRIISTAPSTAWIKAEYNSLNDTLLTYGSEETIFSSTDWQHYKKITISGSSGAGTNYQVLLKVGESSGASGYDFHLEGNSANFPSDKNDGGDLRFTSSDGQTLLPFWVEEVEGTSPNRTAKIWVRVADNLDSNQDIYCYTPEHDIFTEKGWINIKNYVENKDNWKYKIATLNPKTNKVEFYYPERVFKLKHKGIIIKQEGSVEFEVTPNHRLWIKPYKNRIKENIKWQFREAGNFPRYSKFKVDFPFEGERKDYFLLPGYSLKWDVRESKPRKFNKCSKLKRTKSHTCFREVKPKKIPMNAWLRFLGIYLAEGSLRKSRCPKSNSESFSISISHKKDERIEKIISDIGFKPYYIQAKNRSTGQYLIHSRQLANYLKQFRKAKDKFIPREFLNLDKSQLKELLYGLMLGDGSYYKNGKGVGYYATISKQLADDIQELALKIGLVAKITKKPKDSFKWGKHDIYIVNLSKRKEVNPNSHTDRRKRIEYDGFVYCVQVPNHIIYVRKNGKPHWNGNCYYGNASASNASNGVDTFNLFDDFDPDKQSWTVLAGTWSNETGYEGNSKKGVHDGSSGNRKSLLGINFSIADFVLYAKVRSTVDNSLANIVFRAADNSNDGNDRIWVRLDQRAVDTAAHNGGFHLIEDVGGTESVKGHCDFAPTVSQWYDVKLEVLGDTVKGYLDGDLKWTATVSRTSAGYVLLQTEYLSGHDAWFDNLRVRKYTDPEPSFSSAGEEQNTTPTSSSNSILFAINF